MNIISAEEARFQSKNGEKFEKIKDNIGEAIIRATENGVCCCTVSIDINTNGLIRKKLLEYFTKLGYKISITDNAAHERNCPIDQMSYYDRVNISW